MSGIPEAVTVTIPGLVSDFGTGNETDDFVVGVPVLLGSVTVVLPVDVDDPDAVVEVNRRRLSLSGSPEAVTVTIPGVVSGNETGDFVVEVPVLEDPVTVMLPVSADDPDPDTVVEVDRLGD